MRGLFQTLFFFFLLSSGYAAAAQRFAYIYIQGDKKTPFYVKLDGEMAPRYGKNYCILPQLAAGATHLQILFQQNAYPAQDYTILVPEGGSRSFMLAMKDGGYQLYDMEQEFYLPPGNKEEDDHMPASTPSTLASSNALLRGETPEAGGQAERPPGGQPAQPITRTQKPPKSNTASTGSRRPVIPKPVGRKPVAAPGNNGGNGQPAFIGGMELDRNGGGGVSENGVPAGADSAVSGGVRIAGAHIINSDCPAPVSTEVFSGIFSKLGGRAGDEERLRYLEGQLDKCYESWQARSLAGTLEGDAARYSLLKKIYPRITDQEAFPLLDDLLRGETWKTEFHRLVRSE